MNRLTLPALTLALLGLPGPSSAMTPQEEAAFRQSCTADYMRFCSMFDPDSPQVDQCFKSRLKELSPQCQSTIAAYSKKNPGGRR